MFFNLLYIHLFRPFLKYSPTNSPLPSNVSPRKLCTTAAGTISKLLRLYKRSHGLRQICNIAVYIAQSACTIHLLNLPDKNAKRDITHGLKHLEEIAESWPAARRTLSILSVLSSKWSVELAEEAAQVLERCEEKFGPFKENYSTSVHRKRSSLQSSISPSAISPHQVMQHMPPAANVQNYFSEAGSPASAMPPSSAQDFHIYPPATTQAAQTPLSTTSPGQIGHRPSIDSVAHATPASKASPSDIFGGVDQLLRTSDTGGDWWLRDQHQLAMGFDNWTDAEAAGAWFAAGMPANSLNNITAGPVGGVAPNGQVHDTANSGQQRNSPPPIGTNGTGINPAMHSLASAHSQTYPSAGAQQPQPANATNGQGVVNGTYGNGFPVMHYDETQWYS